MGLNHYFLLMLLPFCSAKDTVPIFLIDHNQVMGHLFTEQNPFVRTSVTTFTDIIEDAISQSSVIIIFVEERLCSEDISMRDKNGSPFQNLREQLMTFKVKYIPNVVTPVKLLTRLLEPTESNVFILQPDQNFKPMENIKFFYVYFKGDRNETRADALRRYDKVMQEVYETTRKIANGAVVAFYTGKVNPVMFSKYDYISSDVYFGYDPNDVLMASHGALLRFKGLTIDQPTPTRRTADMDLEETPKIIRNQKTQNATVTQLAVGKYYMKFFFNFLEEHWTLDTIKVYQEDEVVGEKEHLDIRVPYGRSYFCDEPLVFYNKDRSSIVIPEYQLQPFRQEGMSRVERLGSNDTSTKATKSTDMKNGTEAGTKNETAKQGSNVTRIAKKGKKGEDETTNEKILDFGEPVKCTNYFNLVILIGLSVFVIFLIVLKLTLFILYHKVMEDSKQ